MASIVSATVIAFLPSTRAEAAPKAAASLKDAVTGSEVIRVRMLSDRRISAADEKFGDENAIHIYLSLRDESSPYVVSLGWFVLIKGKSGEAKLLDEFGEKISLPFLKPERPQFNKADLMAINGFDSVSKGKLKAGLAAFENALKLAPESPRLHNNRGALLAVAERNVEAQKEFSAALKLKPDYAAALANMAWLSLAINQPEIAEQDARRALKIDPAMQSAKLALAKANLSTGKSSQSAHVLDTMRGFAKTDLQTLTVLADTQLSERNFKEARKTLKRIVFLSPSDSDALLKLGQACDAEGDIDEALKYLRQAAQISPQEPAIHLALGKALEHNRDERAAWIQYKMVLELCPAAKDLICGNYRPKVQAAMLKMLVRAESLPEADKLTKQWIKESPGSADCHYNRAWILSQLPGQEKEAVSAYEKALSINPKMTQARYNLALLLVKVGRIADGAKQLKQFIEAAPGDPDVGQARSLLAELESESTRR
ncbi:MAG TPA: tetratricopeptide repeat protein [Candidatus Obscuribacterales bacterium]